MQLLADPTGNMTGGSLAGLRDESPESPSPTTTIPVSADCVGTGTVGTCEKGTNSVQRSCILRRSVVRTRNRAVLALHILIGIPLQSACQLARIPPVQMCLIGIGCLNSLQVECGWSLRRLRRLPSYFPEGLLTSCPDLVPYCSYLDVAREVRIHEWMTTRRLACCTVFLARVGSVSGRCLLFYSVS